MPDDRFFHKRAGHSAKVNQLTDFEELIWRYYVLSADDFGVMRFTAAQIRTDHERAERRSDKLIQRALERCHAVGLVYTFEHQDRVYCYSRNWQQFQKVLYPRTTLLPCPPAEELAACDESTRHHFLAHPGGKEGLSHRRRLESISETFQENSKNDSENVSEIVGEDFPIARSRARRLTATATAEEAKATADGFARARDDLPGRAGAFCEWYAETHARLAGVGYLGNPRKDYETALHLVATFSDDDLHDAAFVWFGQQDSFAVTGTRTITKFASRVSALVQTAREVAR